jgi:pilus assembly protein Flp/PilA
MHKHGKPKPTFKLLPEVKTMKQAITKFLRDEEGLTTVEYAIAGALVGAAVILSFTSLGTQVGLVIDGITSDIGG